MTPRTVTEVKATAVRPGRHLQIPERLATEEPMEIRVAGPGQVATPIGITMRTPGHDFELAAGFLLTEGLIAGPGDITGAGYCLDADEDQRFNTVTVTVATAWAQDGPHRVVVSNSSCGVCGKTSLDQVDKACRPLPLGPRLPASFLSALPDRLRQSQPIFEQTGGLHAAGLFGPDGALEVLREDIGRHNAVDKVIGHGALHHRPPQAGSVLMVSGRVGFEIVQKAAMGGVATVAAVSAPSSLAVQAAQRLGVTLAGFVRGQTYNIYAHPERIDLDD